MVIGLILNFVVFYNIPIPEIADKDLKNLEFLAVKDMNIKAT